MNFRLVLIISITILLLTPTNLNSAPIWGKTGHRTVGAIAENYLKRKTKRKLAKLLNHGSLAFSSTFADEIKSDDRYKKFSTWHYVNMPFDITYEESTKNEEGDLVSGIAYCKKIILDDTSSNDDKAFYLKMLIHLVGDLHQPMHVGLESDRGGNDIKLQWQFKDTNLHSVWDSKMIDDYGMSYIELANNLDYITKAQVKAIQSGSIEDWVNDSQQVAKVVYASVKEGDNLRNDYMYLNFDTVRTQLQKGGIRLAKVLNELF
ncbi:MAG: S1/P1 nuclease [Aquaticitalea sp.]